ncbi:glycosyltransferase [Nodosilinea sp. FACHB-131]|uniref:glycosyltransferase n=1 Tax=Cyanophyceae TaxID=3028117 RepID=UPI0016857276|nr:glycosyltransferase [Nodosilinea sp. FACHB-131]MBD1872384.1 glycosyltransferase [Nodosilinea sp. FACHB-131]
MTQPVVSIIIPVYNDRDRLALCLDALDHQTYPSDQYEVIVIDNGSDAPLADLVSQFKQVRLTHENQPGSYAARNHGLTLARGEIIGFTDSDCIPAKNWIETGVAQFLATPNCGLVAGKIELFFKQCDRPTAVELFDSRNFLQQHRYITEDHYGATANLFTSKAIFDAVGLFNAQLKSGGDREWGQRVYAAGYPQIYADDVCIAHPARHSWPEISKKIVRVIEGRYKMEHQQTEPITRFLKRMAWQTRPPMQDISRVFADKKVPSLHHRLKLSMVFISIRYLSLWKEIQLYFKARLAQ